MAAGVVTGVAAAAGVFTEALALTRSFSSVSASASSLHVSPRAWSARTSSEVSAGLGLGGGAVAGFATAVGIGLTGGSIARGCRYVFG